MKRVMVLANNLSQASFRLRIAALLPRLRQRGYDLHVHLRPTKISRVLAWRRLLMSAGQWDAVIVQRKLLDGVSARMLRKSARRIFYDVDDAVMFHNRPVGLVSRVRTRRRFLATARAADHVVAGNQYLADIFRVQGCTASVIPTVVDCSRYPVKVHEPTQSPRLVWIGSRSTLCYVEQFRGALESAADRVAGLRLLTIADETIASERLLIEHESWSRETEAAALSRGDIGIAPMPADPWTLGKCGFKILQYMATGLPVIASPVGANGDIVKDGVTGLLPSRAEDWPGAIARLATDVELRRSMGAAGRAATETDYSLDRAADQWAQILA